MVDKGGSTHCFKIDCKITHDFFRFRDLSVMFVHDFCFSALIIKVLGITSFWLSVLKCLPLCNGHVFPVPAAYSINLH